MSPLGQTAAIPSVSDDWRVCASCQAAFALNEADIEFQRRNMPEFDIDEEMKDPNAEFLCASCTITRFDVGNRIFETVRRPGLSRWYFKKFLLRFFFGVDLRMAAMHAGCTTIGPRSSATNGGKRN